MYALHQKLNEAARRNNLGAFYLDNHQIDKGVDEICSALQEFQLLQESFPSNTSNGTSASWVVRLPEDDVTGSSLPDIINEEEGFIYTRPLHIPYQEAGWEQVPSSDSVTEVSFIIIYNLALAYHMKGTTESELIHGRRLTKIESLEFLHKSKSLYDIAYQLMVSKPESFCVNLSLVVSNNLGHVLQATCDYVRANECFTHLLSVVMYLKDVGGMDELKLMDGFLKSTSHLVLKRATAAAA